MRAEEKWRVFVVISIIIMFVYVAQRQMVKMKIKREKFTITSWVLSVDVNISTRGDEISNKWKPRSETLCVVETKNQEWCVKRRNNKKNPRDSFRFRILSHSHLIHINIRRHRVVYIILPTTFNSFALFHSLLTIASKLLLDSLHQNNRTEQNEDGEKSSEVYDEVNTERT